MSDTKKIGSMAVNALLIMGIIGCFVYLAFWGYQYLKNVLEVSTVQNEFAITDTKTVLSDTKGLFDDVPDVSINDTGLLTDMQALKLLSKTNSLSIDHKGLLEQNSDYIGWVQIPDTEVNYPVYKSSDNNDYLHHNAKGEYSYAGCIFMDCGNESIDDFNVIFHGHNMRIGTMFHSLKSYTSVGYYNTHPFVIFYSKDGTRRIYRIYSFYSKSASALRDTAYKTSFNDEEERRSFIDTTMGMSSIKTNQAIDTDTHILTLSTCTSSGNGRFVVQAYQLDNKKLSQIYAESEGSK